MVNPKQCFKLHPTYRFSSINHTLDVKAVNKYKSKHNTEREFKELDFGTMPQRLQEEYMDIY